MSGGAIGGGLGPLILSGFTPQRETPQQLIPLIGLGALGGGIGAGLGGPLGAGLGGGLGGFLGSRF